MDDTTSAHLILLAVPPVHLRIWDLVVFREGDEGEVHIVPYVAVGMALAATARIFLAMLYWSVNYSIQCPVSLIHAGVNMCTLFFAQRWRSCIFIFRCI